MTNFFFPSIPEANNVCSESIPINGVVHSHLTVSVRLQDMSVTITPGHCGLSL